MFNWDDLRIFLAVFREGSFSEAARTLRMSQSTVSRRMASLEKDLGVRLFDRTPGGLMATEVAKELEQEAKQTEQSTLEIMRLMKGRDARLDGIVRLAVPDGVSSNLIAPMLPLFTQRHPEVRLEVISGNQLLDLSRREADLALRFVKPTSGDLVFRRVAHSPFGLYGNPSYIEHFGQITSLEDLKQLDWLTWDHNLAHLPESTWFNRQIQVTPRLRSSNMDTLFQATFAGLGVTVMPKLFGKWMSLLQEIPLPIDLPIEMSMWLVGHQTLRHMPRVQVVWDFLIELLQELQEETPETTQLFTGIRGPIAWIWGT